MTETSILTTLNTLLSESRVQHSIRVAELAKTLAIHHKENPKKAYIAGLIHDCAKELSPSHTQLEFSQHEITLYNQYPKVWHAFVIKTVASHYFQISDTDIINAAKWHSTGTANMSPLSQILYIADYIEPNRPFDNLQALLELAHSSLNSCVLTICKQTIQHLINTKLPIHPESINCHNFYTQQLTKPNH